MIQFTIFFLAFVCVLAYFGGAQTECCHTSLKLRYTANHCADGGGYLNKRETCEVIICADGKPKMYRYCGKGDCNIFGCNCEGGCRTGDWKSSFVDNYQGKGITVTDELWPRFICI